MVWYGMVWYGMVWYGVVWYLVWHDMVSYGMVWHGMAWYGIVKVCEGAPVVMGGWVLTDRHDLLTTVHSTRLFTQTGGVRKTLLSCQHDSSMIM